MNSVKINIKIIEEFNTKQDLFKHLSIKILTSFHNNSIDPNKI